ncbi:MAG: cation-translocating P-type ATPase, partial [Bacteroidia bacterium]
MKAFYQLSKEEVLHTLQTSAGGLKKSGIPALQQKYGKNELQEQKQKSRLTILIAQFKNVMILILIIAAFISFIVGESTDAYVILAIVIANAWLGYSQEFKAEEAIAMLKKMAAQFAFVIRDNNPVKTEAKELVPGDIILLTAGDIIPADARLLEINSFRTEEAALTGESHAVDKITAALEGENLGPADQRNMVFKGTIVGSGSAKAVVTHTGMYTQIGKIAGLLELEDQKTPLQKRLEVFSKQLAVVVLVICVIVFGFGLWRGEPTFVMFLTALSLAVAALPEALPAVVTIALARGAKKMAQQKALIRKLPAVETLGSVTYICSDKTGTLTQNVMTVEKSLAAEGLDELLKHAMLLNHEVNFADDGNMLGDSTETALVNYALLMGHSLAETNQKFPLAAKLPFDSDRMRMSTLHQHRDKWILFVKGAPVRILEILSAEQQNKTKAWQETNRKWAAEGLRVLFFGYKILDEKPAEINEEIERDLNFLGIAALIDPPREEVIAAIDDCKSAGIKTVMITGDQPLTAYAIAERLNMISPGQKATLSGAELADLTEEEFTREVKNISVYARVSPEQKLNIVKALQQNGEFVAMTGDGVNDAPSLKQADIGVAMGIMGTDVSKAAADMILLDDNFATIVKAVKEGRRIYENIKKFILYVLCCNLAEILTIFFAPIVGLAIPLLPIHILWINLVTDGLPGLALTSEPAEKNIMKQPPRPTNENLFAGGMVFKILTTGIIMAAAVILTQFWAASNGYDVKAQRTIVFTLLCFTQLGHVFSIRLTYHYILSKSIFSNIGIWITVVLTAGLQLLIVYLPVFQPIFKTVPLDWQAMRMILIATAVCIAMFELIKYVSLQKKHK